MAYSYRCIQVWRGIKLSFSSVCFLSVPSLQGKLFWDFQLWQKICSSAEGWLTRVPSKAKYRWELKHHPHHLVCCCSSIFWETTCWLSCVEAFMKHSASWREGKKPAQSPPEETFSFSWLGTGPKQWPVALWSEGSHSPSGIPYILTFLVIYTAVKPKAGKLVFPPFHFLSLQPYRNSWVTQDKHPQNNNASKRVKKKRKCVYEMPAAHANSKYSTRSVYK